MQTTSQMILQKPTRARAYTNLRRAVLEFDECGVELFVEQKVEVAELLILLLQIRNHAVARLELELKLRRRHCR